MIVSKSTGLQTLRDSYDQEITFFASLLHPHVSILANKYRS